MLGGPIKNVKGRLTGSMSMSSRSVTMLTSWVEWSEVSEGGASAPEAAATGGTVDELPGRKKDGGGAEEEEEEEEDPPPAASCDRCASMDVTAREANRTCPGMAKTVPGTG